MADARLDIIRAALDAELQNQAYTQLDHNGSGHVVLVDGDVDTGDLAEAVAEALAAAGLGQP